VNLLESPRVKQDSVFGEKQFILSKYVAAYRKICHYAGIARAA
jgi:hypothetical protein